MRIIYIPAKSSLTVIKYGYLYNWYVVNDARNVANTGWHVPSRTEFETMQTYLGGSSVAGGKLKETGTTHWNSPNTGATNSALFNGRGNGERLHVIGGFEDIKLLGNYYSTTLFNSGNAYGFLLGHDDGEFVLSIASLRVGWALRLVKDSTTLSDGETSIYTGNDGKIYGTICIGTQEWLADNLAETKYRNLDSIPTVTDNGTWIGLTTGAKCAYYNDENNV
jgi:uncharacterized protein (TIGR02145 family)